MAGPSAARPSGGGELPASIAPMLCRAARPFSSPDFLFEFKWDGVRAIAFVDGPEQYRLQSRHRGDLAGRYPELAGLGGLPAGTVLDGELVVLGPDGRPDFGAALARENARRRDRIAQGARTRPVTFVVFDLLYRDFQPLLDAPLRQRRQALAELLAHRQTARLACSEGVEAAGEELFEVAQQRGLEGMVAKRLDSAYRPGVRSEHWRKVKVRRQLHCAILGYEPAEGRAAGDGAFRSLIVASDVDGELRCVGKVGTGFTAAVRDRLQELLRARGREQPWLAVDQPGCWVEPGLYCSVSYLERTASGSLRAPVFVELIEG